jgi:thioredoxin-related protein
MGIAYLMGLCPDCSQKVVAQFYATFYVDQDENEMHFTLGGKRFKISISELASLFKLRAATTINQFSSELF